MSVHKFFDKTTARIMEFFFKGEVPTWKDPEGNEFTLNNPIYGTCFSYASRTEQVDYTINSTLLEYAALTTDCPAGLYEFKMFIIWSLSTTTSNFISQAIVNGTIIGELSLEATDSGTDVRAPESGVFYYNHTGGSLSAAIFFGPQNNGVTAKMYHAVISKIRVQ